MTNTYFVFVFLTLHLILVDALLLDNINNQQKTTPSSSYHQDSMVFLMQEVIQIKNILQEKTKELDKGINSGQSIVNVPQFNERTRIADERKEHL